MRSATSSNSSKAARNRTERRQASSATSTACAISSCDKDWRSSRARKTSSHGRGSTLSVMRVSYVGCKPTQILPAEDDAPRPTRGLATARGEAEGQRWMLNHAKGGARRRRLPLGNFRQSSRGIRLRSGCRRSRTIRYRSFPRARHRSSEGGATRGAHHRQTACVVRARLSNAHCRSTAHPRRLDGRQLMIQHASNRLQSLSAIASAFQIENGPCHTAR